MKKNILFLILISVISLNTYSKVKVEEAQTIDISYDVVNSIDYQKEIEIDIKPVERVDYAEYVVAIVDAVKSADEAAITKVIIKTIDELGQSKAITVIIEALSKIDYSSYTSAEIVSIMEATMAAMSKANVNVTLPAKTAEKIKELKWYEMSNLAESGSGLWAIITKAKYKAERGEDISTLYALFLQVLNESSLTTK